MYAIIGKLWYYVAGGSRKRLQAVYNPNDIPRASNLVIFLWSYAIAASTLEVI